MRKLMILAMMLAMVLVAAAPALAQSNASGQYGNSDQIFCTDVDPETAQQLLDEDPIVWATLDADGDGTACNEEHVPELACEEFVTQEEAQKFLDENPGDPYNIDSDGNGVACDFKKGSASQDEEATLSYELAVEGECATDATFFGENNLVGAADYVGTAQLTDPDGDGVYTHSEEFPVGSQFDGLSIVQGTGVDSINGAFFQGSVPGDPITTIKIFVPITLEEDTTLSASISCDDPVEPQKDQATLGFELAVDGQCAADTNFFAGMSTSHGYSVPLADPDGDGVYFGSIEFDQGVELLEVLIYKGAGLQEGPYGQIPVGEPETIQNFGPLTVTQDETFSAAITCEEPTEPKNPQTQNPEKNSSTGSSENVQAGLKMLPDTGGMSVVLLGSGILLVAGGLVARRIIG
ncbi:hypothetical protein BH24ACT21_BH24ACT21_14050 [soil metagenome]